MKKIITHSGAAHRDEFYAVALALAHAVPGDPDRFEGVLPPVFRVSDTDITKEEFENPDVWIIDIGRRHEPSLSNFDHHQFSKHADSSCAYSLVLQHLGLYEPACKAFPSVKAIEIMDSKGPEALAQHLTRNQMDRAYKKLPGALKGALPKDADIGKVSKTVMNCIQNNADTKTEVMMPLFQPLENFILSQFQKKTKWTSEFDPWHLLLGLGQSMITMITNFEDMLNVLRREGEILDIDGVKTLVVPESIHKVLGINQIMDAWRKEACPEAAVSIAPDTPRYSRDKNRPSTGMGYALYRFEDSHLLDFTRVSDDPEVEFTHANGFLAKTRKKDRATAIRLIRAAIL